MAQPLGLDLAVEGLRSEDYLHALNACYEIVPPGLEVDFERIAVRIDGDLPAGPAWHILLLQRMSQPFGDARPAVIERDLETKLVEYLRFRHLFRHTYGYNLEWAPVRKLSEPLPDLLSKLKMQLGLFLDRLRA